MKEKRAYRLSTLISEEEQEDRDRGRWIPDKGQIAILRDNNSRTTGTANEYLNRSPPVTLNPDAAYVHMLMRDSRKRMNRVRSLGLFPPYFLPD